MHVLSSHELIAIIWCLVMLAFQFTVGRFAIHWYRNRKMQWDNVLHGLPMLFLFAFAGTYQVFGPIEYELQLSGMGLIDPRVPLDEATRWRARRYNAANTFLFWCVIYSVKMSFLALYWRVFNISWRFRLAWRLAVGYTAIAFGVTFMWPFWHCYQPKYYLKAAKCPKAPPSYINAMLITWCVLDLVGDLVLVALPVAMLKNLMMRRSQKIELAIIFGLVVVNIVCEILRTIYSMNLDLQRFPDQNVLWVFLQANIAVIVCALPCYRGLFSKRSASRETEFKTEGRVSIQPMGPYTFSSSSSEFPGTSWRETN